MRFSVVIPVYNVADYLCQCIDSVLANDYKDFEIVLVDDGATDGVCPGLCDRYEQQHPDQIRVIHQQNQGLGGARNTGLKAARGEYVFFVDSDDYISPESLRILSDAVDASHADIYSFQIVCTDGNGKDEPLQISQNYPEPFCLKQQPNFLLALPAAWARIWRRELLLDSGVWYPSRVWYEDIRTSSKWFALADSIHVLPEHLYFYRNMRTGSIMRSSDPRRNREILEAFDDILSWFDAQKLSQRYSDELCRLAVDHILLAATVRVARVDPKASLLGEFTGYMQEHFPAYRQNPYLSELSGQHKLLLKLIGAKQYRLIWLLFRLKDGGKNP